jgi:hypothetical protein
MQADSWRIPSLLFLNLRTRRAMFSSPVINRTEFRDVVGSDVAQVFNLLYRRLSSLQPLERSSDMMLPTAQHDEGFCPARLSSFSKCAAREKQPIKLAAATDSHVMWLESVRPMQSIKKVYLGSLAALLVGAGLLAWMIVTGSREQRRLQARIQEKLASIKSAGGPVTAEDLVRLHPNPLPEQDATLVLGRPLSLAAAAPSPSKVPLMGGKFPEGVGDMDDETKAAVETFLESNRPALAALPPVTNETWFPGPFANGFTNSTRLPLVEIRRLVQVLCVNAIAHAETNGASGCLRSLEWSFRAGRTLRSDSMVGHMIRRAVEGVACQALERSVNRIAFSDQQLVALTAVVTNVQPDGFKSALEVERALGIWAMQLFQSAIQQKNYRWTSPLEFFLARRSFKDEDFLLYLDRVESYLQALNQPFPARLQRIAALDRDIKKGSRSVWTIAIPHWSKAATNDAEIQARLFVASVALAIERYRLSHGRLPSTLSDLVPEYFPAVPLDPYATTALKYKRLPNGFVVYSIGQDGRDNGGSKKPEQVSEATSYDLPFSVER